MNKIKLDIYNSVMELVNKDLTLLQIVDNMSDWKLDAISNNRLTLSKWIGVNHVVVSVFYGDCIRNVTVF